MDTFDWLLGTKDQGLEFKLGKKRHSGSQFRAGWGRRKGKMGA